MHISYWVYTSLSDVHPVTRSAASPAVSFARDPPFRHVWTSPCFMLFHPVVPRYFFLYNSIYLPGFPLYMAADTAETRGWTWPGVLLATCENENENVNKECISTVQLVYTVLALDARVPVPDMLSRPRARCSPPR